MILSFSSSFPCSLFSAMECPIPSPGPYAHLDYVVKVHFVKEEARVVHVMQTDTNQREYVVTTTSTLMRNGLGNGGQPPALTYCVPPSHWMQFLGQYFFPVLLGPKKCFGTHCRASYQFLHRTVPQQAVWMEFQLASHFSSHLHILTIRRDPPTLQGKRRLEECQRPTHQLRHAPMEPPENTIGEEKNDNNSEEE
ncbi:hypothetical protein JTE90_015027 [Oedothorax gibbosus]|uniref:Uncharacterized protein n=1 Tax=Oedothorax gibbosus TaxID=931172 RepID=A0AAV6TVZ0_9ARAC|nr:hypothetical protein JTE90_015027 [Oedothorax gibbosus]